MSKSFHVVEQNVNIIKMYHIRYHELTKIIAGMDLDYIDGEGVKSIEMILTYAGVTTFESDGIEPPVVHNDMCVPKGLESLRVHIVSARVLRKPYFEINVYNEKILYTFKSPHIKKKPSKYPLKRFLKKKGYHKDVLYSPHKINAIYFVQKGDFLLYRYDAASKKVLTFSMWKEESCHKSIQRILWTGKGGAKAILSYPTLNTSGYFEIVAAKIGFGTRKYHLVESNIEDS